MKKQNEHRVLYEPFDLTMIINVSGITRSDGEKTLTVSMIVDKTTAPVYRLLDENLLRDVNVEVKVNNIEKAKEIISKSKREY